MLRFQGQLPRLPVPVLEETCELYLRLVRPLVTDVDFAATEHEVSEFMRPGGFGEELQRRLVESSERADNWLEPFWNDWYLCDDMPLAVNVSPGFVLAGTGEQIARAAGLLAAVLEFKQLVDREELEPDREGESPRCMFEYARVLSSTRIPGRARDELEHHPGSRHVAVARGDRLFSLDVLDEEGVAYPRSDLERALQLIVDDTPAHAVPIGVLTADRRRTWAATRDLLVREGGQEIRDALVALESAIALLVLESDPPPAQPRSVEAARIVLHGGARSRWFDKSIQLIVASNGVAGFCMEHSGFDGSTALRFAAFLVEHEGSRSSEARPAHAMPTARPLSFEPTEQLLEAIDRSERHAAELVARTDLAVLDFGDFGKEAVVAHGVSPDGFVQMAFQLAYLTLTGRFDSTYESVDTKRFLHGRTEAMRCVSEESVAFVRALRGGTRAAADAESLRTAIATHSEIVKRCKAGRGVDRHLLGLRRMLRPEEPVPALFEDRAYLTLTRSVLSTSALPSTPGVELIVFGPVVDEGFGLSYTIHSESIRVVVTSFHGQAGAFADELERSLIEMEALLANS